MAGLCAYSDRLQAFQSYYNKNIYTYIGLFGIVVYCIIPSEVCIIRIFCLFTYPQIGLIYPEYVDVEPHFKRLQLQVSLDQTLFTQLAERHFRENPHTKHIF